MARYFRRIPYSTLALAVYVVCLLLVVSFILFEVLDVDGSDFPTPTHQATTIRLVDPPHDVKRAHLQAVADGWMDCCRLFAPARDQCVGLSVTMLAPGPPSPTPAHRFRPALARSALGEALPAA